MVCGLVVAWLAVRMRQGYLRYGSATGLRTPSTMRSEAAFEAANKAAAPLAGVAGPFLVACGVLAAAVPRHLAGAFVFGGVGVFLVLLAVSGVTGVRASRSAP
jgi:hypothetical protein